ATLSRILDTESRSSGLLDVGDRVYLPRIIQRGSHAQTHNNPRHPYARAAAPARRPARSAAAERARRLRRLPPRRRLFRLRGRQIMDLYSIVKTLHVLSAIVWVGG